MLTSQPTPPENYYKLLNLQEHFQIDPTLLSTNFKTLQRQWHPDKFHHATPTKKAQAAEMSAKLNEAYATLRAPDRRAQHLLHLRTLISAPDGAPAHPPLDPAFLAWVVDTREDVAAAAGDPKRLRPLVEDAKAAVEQCLAALGAAFDAGDLLRAGEETGKLQYLRRIERAIDDYSV